MIIDDGRGNIPNVLGMSVSQSRAIFITKRELEILQSTNPNIKDYKHSCGIVSYLDFNPVEQPELFHCECQSLETHPLKQRYVCNVGHPWYGSRSGFIPPNDADCPRCKEVLNTLTPKEMELRKNIIANNRNTNEPVKGFKENPDLFNPEILRFKKFAKIMAEVNKELEKNV